MAQVKFVTWLAGLVNKSTPTDTDQMYVGDAGTSKYSTWAQVKATLKTYFDTLYAKIGLATGSGLTSSTAKLLGRSTAGTGALEEITLGTNLSFTGSTLNAAGGGGGSPGGATTQVQFNDAGAFAGDALFTFDKTTKSVTLAGLKTLPKDTILRIGGPGSDAHLGAYYGLSTIWDATKTVGARMGPSQIVLPSNAFYGFSSNATDGAVASGAEIALARSSATILEVNSSSPGVLLDLKLRNLVGTGNLATGISNKTTAYTATVNDYAIEGNATTAAFVVTLFPCSGNAGKMLLIKKMDASANAVTVDANASETIDGALTVVLAAQYSDITIQVNAAGTGWNKVSGV